MDGKLRIEWFKPPFEKLEAWIIAVIRAQYDIRTDRQIQDYSYFFLGEVNSISKSLAKKDKAFQGLGSYKEIFDLIKATYDKYLSNNVQETLRSLHLKRANVQYVIGRIHPFLDGFSHVYELNTSVNDTPTKAIEMIYHIQNICVELRLLSLFRYKQYSSTDAKLSHSESVDLANRILVGYLLSHLPPLLELKFAEYCSVVYKGSQPNSYRFAHLNKFLKDYVSQLDVNTWRRARSRENASKMPQLSCLQTTERLIEDSTKMSSIDSIEETSGTKQIASTEQTPSTEQMSSDQARSKDTGGKAMFFSRHPDVEGESLIHLLKVVQSQDCHVFEKFDHYPFSLVSRMISECHVFVVIFTPAYLRNPYCLAELTCAFQANIDTAVLFSSRGNSANEYSPSLSTFTQPDATIHFLKLLDENGWKVLDTLGFSQSDVQEALVWCSEQPHWDYHRYAMINIKNKELNSVIEFLKQVGNSPNAYKRFAEARTKSDFEEMILIAEQNFDSNHSRILVLQLCKHMLDKRLNQTCFAVCKLICKVGMINLDDYLAYTLSQVMHILQENNINLSFLTVHGACNVLVKILIIHFNQENIVELVFQVLATFLTSRDISSDCIKQLDCTTFCECIIKGTNFHMKNKRIASNALKIINAVSSNDLLRNTFEWFDVENIVVQVLNLHPKEQVVVEIGCFLLSALGMLRNSRTSSFNTHSKGHSKVQVIKISDL